jgi:hypothetical protein
MLQLKLVPQIHMFNTFGEFAKEFKIDEHDLSSRHEFIYEPLHEVLRDLKCEPSCSRKNTVPVEPTRHHGQRDSGVTRATKLTSALLQSAGGSTWWILSAQLLADQKT